MITDWFGRAVQVTADRPLGSCYSEHRDLYYPVNYGYIEEIRRTAAFREQHFDSEIILL